MTEEEDQRERAAREPRHALAGRTVVLSGGVQGVGAALAVGLGQERANVVLLTKPSTGPVAPELLSVVDAIEGAGGRSMVVSADIRHEMAVADAVDEAVARFGGIDACINNASALSLAGTETVPMTVFDLMMQVNVRGAFVLTRACLAHLKNAPRPHILTISPPLNLAARWLGGHPPYTLSKYGMTLLALGWASEFGPDGIASNCLWPERSLSTGNVVDLLGAQADRFARRPEVMADAACAILASPVDVTAQCFLDGDVLRGAGATDLGRYGGDDPQTDLFVGT